MDGLSYVPVFCIQADESDPFKKFNLRTKETTCRTLERLVVVRDKAALQTQTGVKLYDNCLWNYLDPHRYTYHFKRNVMI